MSPTRRFAVRDARDVVDAEAGDAERRHVLPDFARLPADVDDYALAAALDEIDELFKIRQRELAEVLRADDCAEEHRLRNRRREADVHRRGRVGLYRLHRNFAETVHRLRILARSMFSVLSTPMRKKAFVKAPGIPQEQPISPSTASRRYFIASRCTGRRPSL